MRITAKSPGVQENMDIFILRSICILDRSSCYARSALGYEGTQGDAYSVLNHFTSKLGEIGVCYLRWVFNRGLIVAGLLS